MDGNPEVEEEEVAMTEVQTRGNLGLPVKTPNQDRCFNCNEPGHFSRECPQRMAMAMPMQILDHNSRKPSQASMWFQPQMYAEMPIPQMAQVPMQMTVPTAQVQMQNNTMTDQTASYGTHERGG